MPMPALRAPRPGTRPLLLAAALVGCLRAPAAPAPRADEPRADAPRAATARELSPTQQVRHVLDRLAFGPRPDDEARVQAMGVDRWIAQQLAPARLADPAGDAVAAAFPVLGRSTAELLADYPTGAALRRLAVARAGGDTAANAALARDLRAAQRDAAQLGQAIAAARVAHATASERQLEAVLVDFWLNHFSVFAGKNPLMRHYLVSWERDAIRPHVLGRFRDLLGATAHHPAMLAYLDNAQSVADSGRPRTLPPRLAGRMDAAVRRRMAEAPALAALPPAQRDSLLEQGRQRRRGLNENYARELLELHTLGVDGGYTQHDVTEAARILTGWTIERPGEVGRFRFNALAHDAGEKTVLGVRFPAGRGAAEGEALLDLLARHPATARHIATKLARRFVSDTPPADLVDRAAATFTRTGGDLRETVRTIVTSPEFFARSAWRAKVKSPFEVVVSAMRALGARPDTTPRAAQAVARLGQPIFGRQSPDGWPETGEAWINTGAILARVNFGLALAGGALPTARPRDWPGWAALAGAPRDAQVDGVVRRILAGTVSEEMRAILASGTHPLAGQGEAVRPARARDPLAVTIGLAIGSPEFQRR
ncbi:MAG: DUF1800 domain-containing protein [Gemmatimonadaceae bacterium]|nr:DUF1800 domain-containing protein [Gemmatimonadaceae bacterium]